MNLPEIKKGIPYPKFRGYYFQLLSAMEKGDFIEVNTGYRNFHEYAKRYKMKVKTAQLPNGKTGVWCVKPYKQPKK